MKTKLAIALSVLLYVPSCHRQVNQTAAPNQLILRFELDSLGNIADETVRNKVLTLAKELEKSADKMMMSAYTEQSGSIEQNEATARAMARAVRELMKTQGERNATNVGVDIKGFQNPLDSLNPANMLNRRIEILPL